MSQKLLTGKTKKEKLLDKIRSAGMKKALSDYARTNGKAAQVTEYMADYFCDKFLEFYNSLEGTGEKKMLSALEKTIKSIEEWEDDQASGPGWVRAEEILQSENMMEEIYKHGKEMNFENKEKINDLFLDSYDPNEKDKKKRMKKAVETTVFEMYKSHLNNASKPYNPTI